MSVKRINLTPPPSRPNMLNAQPQRVIDSFNIDRKKYPVVLLGIRGYYLDSQGEKGKNDRNLYDDAIFVDIRLTTKSVCYSFNGNTDPSYVRQGTGNEKGKGMFVLDPGVYYAHRIGLHSNYHALVQWDEWEKGEKKHLPKKGKVKGHRDGGKSGEENKPYPVDWGHYSINIHKGGEGDNDWTWSEGCQTIPKSQWTEFITLIRSEMKRLFKDKFKTKTIPYCLVTDQGHKRILSAQKSVSEAVTDKKSTKQETEAIGAANRKAAQEAAAAAKTAATEATAAKKAAEKAATAAKTAAKAAAAARTASDEATAAAAAKAVAKKK